MSNDTITDMNHLEIQHALDRVLLTVSKPGRYAGGEYNQVVKDWAQIQTRVALAFPDIYDLGMSNLGIATLYKSINDQNDLLAERVYSPWIDMEEVMRRENIPLYSLETKHALTDFDLIGISLPYEQLYSNVLNLLELAQMPLLAKDRDEKFLYRRHIRPGRVRNRKGGFENVRRQKSRRRAHGGYEIRGIPFPTLAARGDRDGYALIDRRTHGAAQHRGIGRTFLRVF